MHIPIRASTRTATVVAAIVSLATARARAQSSPPLPPLPPSQPAPASTPEAAPATAPAPAPADAPAPVPNGCPEGTHVRCHDGFYLRLSLGLGATVLSGESPTGSVSLRGGSIPFRFAVGGTVARGLVFGGARYAASPIFGETARAIGDGYAQYDALTFFADWYPDPHCGWHLGGDLGVGALLVDAPSQDVGGVLAASVTGGYEWWYSDEWSFGATLVASGMTRATLRDSSGYDSGYRLGAGSIGVLATFVYH